jgi:phenylacetate-coenzyme A ligase PaaK-like adenylate-forming protein
MHAVAGTAGLLRAAGRPERLRAFQDRRLRSLVRHAYHRVPYYRRLFDGAGVRPEDIRGVDDLSRIPITERSDVQFLPPSELLASGIDARALLLRRTSGSNGQPLSIRRYVWEERVLLAVRMRERLALGMRLRDRRTSLRFLREADGGGGDRALVGLFGLLRRRTLDWRLPKEDAVHELAEWRPAIVGGTPSMLAWLADELTDEDRQVVRPRLVITAAETLTPAMREQIQRGFGAPVRDIYGSHEFVFIASECPRGGHYHLAEGSLIAEVLRDGKPAAPGEEGELVGTALHSYAMPFLRYRLGDVVVPGPSPCACGAPCATLLAISGRVIDRFILPGGEVVHPYTLANVLRDHVPWLRRFQIVQTAPESFLVRVVPYRTPAANELEETAARLADGLRRRARVEIEIVASLPPSPSGKFFPYVGLERWYASGVEEAAEGSATETPRGERMAQ